MWVPKWKHVGSMWVPHGFHVVPMKGTHSSCWFYKGRRKVLDGFHTDSMWFPPRSHTAAVGVTNENGRFLVGSTLPCGSHQGPTQQLFVGDRRRQESP